MGRCATLLPVVSLSFPSVVGLRLRTPGAGPVSPGPKRRLWNPSCPPPPYPPQLADSPAAQQPPHPLRRLRFPPGFPPTRALRPPPMHVTPPLPPAPPRHPNAASRWSHRSAPPPAWAEPKRPARRRSRSGVWLVRGGPTRLARGRSRAARLLLADCADCGPRHGEQDRAGRADEGEGTRRMGRGAALAGRRHGRRARAGALCPPRRNWDKEGGGGGGCSAGRLSLSATRGFCALRRSSGLPETLTPSIDKIPGSVPTWSRWDQGGWGPRDHLASASAVGKLRPSRSVWSQVCLVGSDCASWA